MCSNCGWDEEEKDERAGSGLCRKCGDLIEPDQEGDLCTGCAQFKGII